MKRILKWMTGSALLLMLLAGFSPNKAQAQAGVSVSFQTFYDELSPYGQWIDDPEYGYVWAPDVDQDFRPYYSRGHWVMTDYGNTWVSDYDWGWAPFHYGRWAQSNSYGWIWVPGNEWGPAWVSWRSGGGCYGWAPMSPGISLSVALGSYYAPDDWWVFIPQQYIYAPSYYSYWRGPRYNYGYIRQSSFINNTYAYNNYHYACGPRRQEVERVLGGRVNIYNIRNERRPGRSELRGSSINMFRPVVNRTAGNDRREAPRNLVRTERSVVDRVPGGARNGMSRRDDNMQIRQGRNDIRNERQMNGMPERRMAPANERNAQRDQFQRDPQRAADDHIQQQLNDRRSRQDMNDRQQMMDRQRQDAQRMEQQQRMDRSRMQEMQQQQRQDVRQQGIDRPQREWRRPEPQPQRIERPQPVERPQPQRMERPQRMEQPRQMERPQPQRMERPQMQQRMERPAPPQQRGFDRGRR